MPEPISIPLVPPHADRPTICPSTIPLVYCFINSFPQASSVERPWPGGEKRRGERASHPVAW